MSISQKVDVDVGHASLKHQLAEVRPNVVGSFCYTCCCSGIFGHDKLRDCVTEMALLDSSSVPGVLPDVVGSFRHTVLFLELLAYDKKCPLRPLHRLFSL
jgi:hypothetical protein